MGYVKNREIESMEPREEPPLWIAMRDHEPRPGSVVLAYSENNEEHRVVKWTGGEWRSDGESEGSWAYSHWMLLPVAPNSQTQATR